MASPAQITANRVNAQYSTGPTSVEGKARSARNARKHGLTSTRLEIADDDRPVFAQMEANLRAETAPGTAKTYPWNPRWTPCSAWIHRAKTTQEFPSPGDWESLAPAPNGPVSMIPFSNGWILLHFKERGWMWAE